MADYRGLEPLLNTASGMTVIVGSRQDDTTNTLTGMPWFHFNGVQASNLYASSNSWIGIGVNGEQLRICRRDGSMYYLYRQEGTLWDGYYDFLKLRFDGYTYYNSENDYHRLIWEAFFISDGRIMLNIIRTPSGDDLGRSELLCGNENVPIPIGYNSGAPYQYILTPANVESGTGWTIEAHVPFVQEPYDRAYLIQDGNGNTYTVEDNQLVQITGGLTVQNFRDYGLDEVDGDILIGLPNPKLCYWHDSNDALPSLTLYTRAVPLVPQLVVFPTTTLGGAINSISIVGDDATLYDVSFDGGTTWYKYNDGWTQVSTEGDGSTRVTLEAINAAGWAAKVSSTLKFRAWFRRGSFMRSIRMDYVG